MPWNETCAMDERYRFVAMYFSQTCSMTALCEDFGISRKTGYKWLGRFREQGKAGLVDQPTTPRSHAAKVPQEALDRCFALKDEKPSWGPKKLIALGRARHPDLYWPAPSTLGKYLDRSGLVTRRKRHHRATPPSMTGLREAKAPNDLWCADYKGQFKTRDKKYCFPLTVTDAHSRFVLACVAMPGISGQACVEVFAMLFDRYGLPEAIRTDNGSPFASVRLGYSQLSLWWGKLGITHERTTPGHPEDNGRHERMHKTLKAETAKPPEANLIRQQDRFDEWCQEFNYERPHEALKQTPPAAHFEKSKTPYPGPLGDAVYPKAYEVRRIRTAGEITWKGKLVYLTQMLAGELVGLTPIDADRWQIWLGETQIAILDERLKKVLPMFVV